MFKQRSRRGGFTLPEVLVTVAIVAVLAAMVVPAVTQQISKGDEGQFSGSIRNLQTAITAYVSDVRRFPYDLTQLETVPTNGDSAWGPAGTLNAALVARWKGPYLQGSLTTGDSVDLGFGLFGKSQMRVDGNYLILRIDGTTSEAVFAKVDSLIDKADGQADGSLRWTDTGTPGTLDSLATYRISVVR